MYEDMYVLMGYGQQYKDILFIPTEERIEFAEVRRKQVESQEATLQAVIGRLFTNSMTGG